MWVTHALKVPWVGPHGLCPPKLMQKHILCTNISHLRKRERDRPLKMWKQAGSLYSRQPSSLGVPGPS